MASGRFHTLSFFLTFHLPRFSFYINIFTFTGTEDTYPIILAMSILLLAAVAGQTTCRLAGHSLPRLLVVQQFLCCHISALRKPVEQIILSIITFREFCNSDFL